MNRGRGRRLVDSSDIYACQSLSWDMIFTNPIHRAPSWGPWFTSLQTDSGGSPDVTFLLSS